MRVPQVAKIHNLRNFTNVRIFFFQFFLKFYFIMRDKFFCRSKYIIIIIIYITKGQNTAQCRKIKFSQPEQCMLRNFSVFLLMLQKLIKNLQK